MPHELAGISSGDKFNKLNTILDERDIDLLLQKLHQVGVKSEVVKIFQAKSTSGELERATQCRFYESPQLMTFS